MTKPLSVIVCGSRHFKRAAAIAHALDMFERAHRRIDLVIHGGAAGVDTAAGAWAAKRVRACTAVPADWRVHGKAAGPLRNARMLVMLAHGSPFDRAVLAFPGGHGTADMVRRAIEAGETVWRCELTDKGGVWRREDAP